MIRLENVSGGYGKLNIINGIGAEFADGELTSIVGANGCGKSTLLMLCAGLLPVSDGRVLIDGDDISSLARNTAAKRISYLAQSRGAVNMSVRSLVSHGRFPYLGYPRRYTAEDKRRISEAMELAGVADISEKLVCELSGGQQQRVRIAMMLAQDTKTVLLDEPLTYLDICHRYDLMELISSLRTMGKCIVTVMHDLDLALSFSDRIAVMDRGSIISFDTPVNTVKGNALETALGVKAELSDVSGQYFFKRCRE